MFKITEKRVLVFLTCRLCDLVGFGVAVATGSQFVLNFPERTYKSMLIPLMQEDKRAGELSSPDYLTLQLF